MTADGKMSRSTPVATPQIQNYVRRFLSMVEKADPTFTPMPEAVSEFQKQFDSENEDDFFPTGFDVHDKVLGRLRRGSITLVGGRPSMGKTAFMLRGALAQLEAGIQVYFFSLEMPRSDMIARLVSIKT